MNKLIEAISLADNERSKITEREKALFGLSSVRLKAFLNNLCSVENTEYLEVGVYKGATLLSAVCDNKTCKAVGIESFTYDEREPKRKAVDGTIWENIKSQLYANMVRYRNPDAKINLDNVRIIEDRFQNVDFSTLSTKFTVCFFDVNPIEETTYDEFLEQIIPHLAEDSIIVFSNQSNKVYAAQLEKALSTRTGVLEVLHKEVRVSNGMSDSTKYYSGIVALSVKVKNTAKAIVKPVVKAPVKAKATNA